MRHLKTELSRKEKNSLFHVLLAAAGIREHKETILEPFGVTSVTDLLEPQLDSVLSRLQEMPTAKKADVPLSIRRLRSSVIMAAEGYMGVKINGMAAWERLNALMMNPKIAGKMLWEMDEAELKKTHIKLLKMSRAMEDKRNKELLISKLN